MPKPDDNLHLLLEARAEIDRALRRHKTDVSILFTDVVGSTSYFEQYGDTAGFVLMHRHADLASAVVREFNGTVIKTIGDSVMASFATPAVAVRAAVQIQRRVQQLNAVTSQRHRLQLRMGINHGRAYEQDSDFFGDAVNLAARVTSQAGPAQILVSRSVHEAIAGEPDLPGRRQGEVAMKGKAEAQVLYEIVWTNEEDYARLRATLDIELARAAPTLGAESPSAGEARADAGPSQSHPPAHIGSSSSPPLVGRTVSHYHILKKLGEGGMGEVYLAQDSTLGRKVALKFLAPDRKQDTTAKRRFIREAQSAAALDHPYICKVYEVAQVPGWDFIAMEYVQGATLKERLAKGALPLDEALTIAVEVAEALAMAHSHGIVHRDLKPSNILLTPDGHVKVMDFGLAKRVVSVPAKAQDETLTRLTKSNSALGTIPYMAPEQVRGDEVDGRSDLFSFGIMVYEMVTGVHPFKQARMMETATAILRDDPAPLNSHIDDVPGMLQQVLEKTLAKQAASRYPSVGEALADLKQVRADRENIVVSARSRGGRFPRAGLALAALAVAVAAIVYLTRVPERGGARLVNPVQVTSAVGVENYPSWSPDGRALAFESNQGGNFDIWVKQLAGGDAINLTWDHPGPDRYPSWSPDGSQIAFLSEREQTWSLYVASAEGGNPRRVASLAMDTSYYRGAPQWSPDSTEIAIALWDAPHNYVELVDMTSRQTRRTPLPKRLGIPCLDLSWSFDGSLFAYVEAEGDPAETTRLWTTSSAGGEPVALTNGRTNDRSPVWSADGRTLFFVSNRGGTMDLWRQSIKQGGQPGGEAEAVTTGLEIRSAAVSSDGARIAYSRGRPLANLWRFPISADRIATWADAEQLTFDNALIEFFDLSPDGKRVAFSSDRAGSQDLWVMPSEGGQLSQLTADPTGNWAPRWSPDGTQIVFYSNRAGNRDIWVMPAGGGAVRQLTSHPTEDTIPTWSPDGTQVVFTSRRSGNRDGWVVSAAGGEPQQITKNLADQHVLDWSPDGKSLLLISQDRLFRIPPAGGEPEQLGLRSAGHFTGRFSPDGRLVYFFRKGASSLDLWALSVEDLRDYQVADLSGRLGALGWGVATDNEYLYFTWAEETGDLWVMDVVNH